MGAGAGLERRGFQVLRLQKQPAVHVALFCPGGLNRGGEGVVAAFAIDSVIGIKGVVVRNELRIVYRGVLKRLPCKELPM